MKKGNISKIEYLEEIPDFVYNIEVEQNHNYYVNGVLTHNCDDPQSPRHAASEVERKNTVEFYDKTLYNRLNQPSIGVRIIVMQRLHQNDLSGHLLTQSPEKHDHIKIPAELTEKNKATVSPQSLLDFYKDNLFWPDRFDKQEIEGYKVRLGSTGAAGQLQQDPTPEGGTIIKESWFIIKPASEISRDSRQSPINYHLDTSYTEDHDNDPNAFLSCFVKDNTLYIVNCIEKWLEFPALCAYTQKYTQIHGYNQNSFVKIEPKASGKSLVSQLRATTSLNVVEAKSPKDDKITRLNSISPLVEAGRVVLIEGPWNKDFIDQVTNQPNSVRWDMTDVFTQAVEEELITDNFNFSFL